MRFEPLSQCCGCSRDLAEVLLPEQPDVQLPRTEYVGEAPDLPEGDPDDPLELGDIAIAHGVCTCEAAAAGRPFDWHVTHLLVHGVLHLLGYDHVEDEDAALMERIEVEILAALGVPDPYAEGNPDDGTGGDGALR